MGSRTHVLLDLDGTLSHSEPSIAASLRHALERVQLPVPADAVIRTAIGPPFELGLPAIGVPDEHVVSVIGHYRDHYEAGGLFDTEPFEGIEAALDAFLDAGLVLAVATAKPEVSALRIVEHFGWTDRFAVIAGATLDDERRTKAAVITSCLSRLGIEPGAHAVMVGDREHDVHGAIENGIDCIGVAWGYGSLEELVLAGAIEVASSPADLVSLVVAP